jgi:peptidyl-prolyl cis-trans isomerase A (cyclophilin A)
LQRASLGLARVLGVALLLLGAACGRGEEGAGSAPSEGAVATADPTEAPADPAPRSKENAVVVIRTSRGEIRAELYAERAPITVANFLTYADEGFFDGTIFHRVIEGFMIQGGGFTPDLKQKPTKAPIQNEAANGLRNERGTLAMARTSAVDSATAQFFINLANNAFLNHGSRDFGYAVFGKVTSGMDVVDAIARAETGNRSGHGDVPLEPVVIESVRRAPGS